MKTVSQSKIEDLIENGYEMKVTEYVTGGIQMVKDNLGLFAGFTVLMFIINSIAGVVPFGSIAVSAPLGAGFIIAAHKIRSGYEIDLSDFFKGFDYFGHLVVYTLLFTLMLAALAIPSGLFIASMVALDFDGDIAAFFAVIFGFSILAVVLYFAVSFMWAPHLILFAKKKAWESMEISHKIIKNDFWNFIGFGMMLGLLNIAGFLCFGVGLLFTIPASACAMYLAFEDVTEMRLENGGYIENHLVD